MTPGASAAPSDAASVTVTATSPSTLRAEMVAGERPREAAAWGNWIPISTGVRRLAACNTADESCSNTGAGVNCVRTGVRGSAGSDLSAKRSRASTQSVASDTRMVMSSNRVSRESGERTWGINSMPPS